MEDGIVRAFLITKGRKSGNSHSVMLRAVIHDGKIYFSRHRPDSDWFQNAIVNSQVLVKIFDKEISGKARLVDNNEFAKKISELKYPGERRALEKRVVLEVTLDE